MQSVKSGMVLFLRQFKVGARLILLLCTALALTLLSTFLASRYFSARIANHYIYRYLQSEHQRAASSLDFYFEEIIMVSLRYKNTANFYSIMQDAKLSPVERELALQEAANRLPRPVSDSISNTYLIDPEGAVYLMYSDIPELPPPATDDWDQLNNTPYYVIGEIVRDCQGNSYLPLGFRFQNFNNGQSIGSLVFYLPERSIAGLYQELLATGGFSFLADEHGMVYSHSNTEYVGKNWSDIADVALAQDTGISTVSYNHERFILISTPLGESTQKIGFPWKLVSMIPYNDLYQVLDQISRALLASGVIVILSAVLLSVIISRRLTKPLQNLQQKLKDLGSGRLDSYVSKHPNDELWELEQGYNEMVARINDLLAKIELEQEKKRELELTALQAQINPHFLYNTLDAIGWMALLKGQDEIEHMVMELSRFFRLSLHKGEKRISIEDEVGIAISYITLEQLRNPGKFDFEYDIQPDIKQMLVPKIILQPIVENAVKHGVSQVRHHGFIRILGYRDGDDIFLEVTDNGAGFLVSSDLSSTSSTGSGYGIKNVRERLQLEFGEQYGVTIWSEIGKGTRVRLHMCFIEEAGELT